MRRHPHGDAVQILRWSKTGEDRYGDPTFEHVPAGEIVCAVSPRFDGATGDSSKDSPGRDSIIIGYTVYPPPGHGLISSDRLIIRGSVQKIEGIPGDWKNPINGRFPGGQVATSEVVG